jgi:aminoglycoside 6-adenylyltransferase
MKKTKEVLEEITSWAERDNDVRAVMLTGSRANLHARADLLSDYDIEIAVNNADRFLESEEWLSAFGDIITIIYVNDVFTLRMVLYKDYVRIDFRIYTIDNFKQYLTQSILPEHWDAGYKVLSDKDKLTVKLKSPAYNAFIITKPVEKEFLSIVTDFWWDVTYVAKSLWRNELFYAKYMMEHVIRFSYLQKMIEWYAGLQNDWKITTNKHGRFFKQSLDNETWMELEKTFAGNVIEENWEALFISLELFSRLASSIANKLDYSYPRKLEIEMTAYIKKIRNLETGATHIN